MYKLCFKDDLEPVEWCDQPHMKIPLFNTEEEAYDYMSKTHGICNFNAFCYVLIYVED